jgi:hypothetical protein
MKAEDYFIKEYGVGHIESVVQIKDLESLFLLIEEYSNSQQSAKIDQLKKEFSDEWIDANYDWIFRDNLKSMRDEIFKKLLG